MSIYLDDYYVTITRGGSFQLTQLQNPSTWEIDMATLKNPQELIKKEAVTILTPLQHSVTSLEVVSPETYQQADTIRAKIKSNRKGLFDRISELVKPAKQAYDALLEFRSEVITPLDEADKIITDKMKVYKLEEARTLAEEQRKRAELQRMLEAEAESKRKAAEDAKTKAMQTRLVNQAVKLQEQAVEVETKPDPVAVKATASSTRTVAKWELKDKMELLKAVVRGEVPEDVVEVDAVVVGKYLRFDRAAVEQFPGIRVYDDVQIVSKR